MLDTWTLTEAAEPRQIIWENLPIKFYARHLRQDIVYVIVVLTIFFYMILIGFILGLTTLANLMRILPFLKPVPKIVVVRTVLEAYLPQIALIIFLALLPMFLMLLTKFEGISTESHAVRGTSGKYFYFTVLNVFIGVTVGGTLFTSFKTVQKEPKSVVSMLGKGLPANATFFITFALKVYVPSFESYGGMWPHMHTRIVAALVTYQITMLGYFGAKKFVYAAFLIPLPILSIILAYICSKKFYPFFNHDALEVLVQDEAKETLDLASIFRAFIPPCLESVKFDDADQFEDALSHFSKFESSV
ncbi:hypothetical protein Syun_028229 [Stephania yunnanensis]|uniref:CSC1/OSCA1-like 7TM region domain-containing protein n=1 Tax=Stephania yunnanensis TaxID=152371 RepID=A0AAP0EMK2_9MAGN